MQTITFNHQILRLPAFAVNLKNYGNKKSQNLEKKLYLGTNSKCGLYLDFLFINEIIFLADATI